MLAGALAGAAGCQALLGIDDTRLADAGEPDVPGFSFAVLTPDSNIVLPLDGGARMEVEIARTGGFTGAVVVQPRLAVNGLVAPAITIDSSQTTGVLIVGAQAPLALGDKVDFELQATSGPEVPGKLKMIRGARVTGKPAAFDTSFGPGASGLTPISFGNDDDGSFYDMLLTGDQKVVVAGWGTGGLGARRFAIARLGEDGRADTTFGNNGLVRIDFESGSSGENAQAYAIGQQSDGRMIAIGSHNATAALPPDVALARIGLNGSTGDVGFGGYRNGKARLDAGGVEVVTDGAVLSDGRILAVGASGPQGLVMRATTTGALDTTFAAPTGYFKVATALRTIVNALAIDASSRIVIAGSIGADGDRDMLLIRLSADGLLDPTFGTNGRVVAGAPSSDERATAVAVRPDGRIVVAGHGNGQGDDDFEVRQFLPTGEPDLTFGDSGVARARVSGNPDRASGLLILPDGELLIVGNSGAFSSENNPSNATPAAVRLTKAGALDPLFDTDGVLMNIPLGDSGVLRGVDRFDGRRVILSGGNQGGTPGPGTFGVIVRMWM